MAKMMRIVVVLVALFCGCRSQGLDLATYQNCEALHPQVKLGWTVHRGNSSVNFLLCGCRQDNLTKLFVDQYVAFGLSANPSQVSMVGGDVTVAWINASTGAVSAVDYYLQSYSQCRLGEGVCPDTQHSSGQCTNDIIPGSVQGSSQDGIQCIAFAKYFTTSDTTCDLSIIPDTDQYVLWAIGGIEETAFKHFIRADATDQPIRLGRTPSNMCSDVSFNCPICEGFSERVFDVRNSDATFVATIGPTGGSRGYASIAGRAGWGYSWYINGTLIPRLVVSRGHTYTFISEGGDDSGVPSNYHPFYLTSSVVGGRLQNTEEQREAETVYAGFTDDGTAVGLGPYCEYVQTSTASDALSNCGSFQEYLNGLSRASCPPLNSPNFEASFTWTPDDTTPDNLYYQCATHRGFGYRITVDPPLSGSSTTGLSSSLLLLLIFVSISLIATVAVI